jgi:23S rRNA (guanosine2251-2'-O)-methyltransferase
VKKEHQDDLVFGTRAIIETIESGKEIDKLLIQKNLSNDLIRELIKIARDHNIPFSAVPVEKLNRVTRKNHQGAIAFISAIHYASLDNVISETYQKGQEPLILILDRVTDVRNFGAIARTAECAGVNAIVLPGRGSAAINADAMKTSAGALNYIPVCRVDNLKTTLQYLTESGITLVACTEKTDKTIYEVNFNRPVAILLGSEEDGISPEYLKMVEERGKIPMTGQIGSLNVSVSAGVALYEVIRQRGL